MIPLVYDTESWEDDWHIEGHEDDINGVVFTSASPHDICLQVSCRSAV